MTTYECVLFSLITAFLMFYARIFLIFRSVGLKKGIFFIFGFLLLQTGTKAAKPGHRDIIAQTGTLGTFASI